MFIFKAILIAISMYSGLPVPQFEWEERPMRYAIAFFPFVGIFTGGLFSLWFYLCALWGLPVMLRTGVAAVIPILLTGGIHLDGFMDTTDAIRSFRPREKRLEILKDPHIGAFGVLGLITYEILYLSFLSVLGLREALILSAGFVLSRSFSGLSVANFKSATHAGSLYAFSKGLSRGIVTGILLIELALSAALMIIISPPYGGAAFGAALIVFIIYRIRSYAVFGGITGDLAGWFLCLAELAMAAGVCVLKCTEIVA